MRIDKKIRFHEKDEKVGSASSSQLLNLSSGKNREREKIGLGSMRLKKLFFGHNFFFFLMRTIFKLSLPR